MIVVVIVVSVQKTSNECAINATAERNYVMSWWFRECCSNLLEKRSWGSARHEDNACIACVVRCVMRDVSQLGDGPYESATAFFKLLFSWSVEMGS